MVCSASDSGSDSGDNDTTDKTRVLDGDQETLNRELQAAKEHDSCLIVIRGTKQGHRFFITMPEMMIGRDPSAQISINDQSISRKHAKVVKLADGRVQLVDQGSSNGTVVNGRKLGAGESLYLNKEDMVKMGNTILKFLPAGEIEILFYGSLNDAAHTDPLTKIYNKGYLLEALEAEFKRAKALHQHFTLLFFDIDHFKKINDTYGHDAGDYVLKEFVNMIRKRHIRNKDVFARYGGEEFVILLQETDAVAAAHRAEEIRAEIQAHPFIYEGKRIAVTSSIGISEMTVNMEAAQTLLKSADTALYAAKKNGRNRIEVAS